MQLLEVLTVGIPFCVFKLLTGRWLGGPGGAALAALGALDLALNLSNLVWLLAFRRRVVDACVLSLAAARLGGGRDPDRLRDLGNSADVLLAMSIVAFMIWEGAVQAFPPALKGLWNACVILDVMGAGLTRFSGSLRRLTDGKTPA